MAQRLSVQGLAWEWVDGVRIAAMEDIPPEERNDWEAYGVARFRQAPEYVCRVTGCKQVMRRAIEQAASCTEDWVLILQDDAELTDSLNLKLKELLRRVPHQAVCVMFPHAGKKVKESSSRCSTAPAGRGLPWKQPVHRESNRKPPRLFPARRTPPSHSC